MQKDLTLLFLESLANEYLKELEGRIRFNLSGKPKDQHIRVIKNSLYHLKLDDSDEFYDDPEEGRVRVISSMHVNLVNNIIDNMDIEKIASIISDLIYVRGLKDYRHEKFILTKELLIAEYNKVTTEIDCTNFNRTKESLGFNPCVKCGTNFSIHEVGSDKYICLLCRSFLVKEHQPVRYTKNEDGKSCCYQCDFCREFYYVHYAILPKTTKICKKCLEEYK
jgi:hypothetical protein